VAELPSGTVTFLFTDVEGSTRLWEEHPEAMRAAMARHDEIVRLAIESNRGHVVKTTGDGFHAVFASAQDAIAASLAMQIAIEQEPWPGTVQLRARIGLHSGEAELRAGDYYGSSTNRAARLMGTGHGGQILASGATAAIVSHDLPEHIELAPLGEHRLRDLEEPIAIFQLTAPGLARDFPALLTLDAYPSNLPAQFSSFVGREPEVAEVAALLVEERLVTLTGVGGVGKTRLALQVAGEVLPRFRGGAWLVELAKVRDPDAVVEAVGVALGAPNRPELPVIDTVVQFLRTKQLLLVLDNCEHVLATAAELVRTLEHTCPHVVVLATSREGLGIAGERLLGVRSLRESESEQLFIGRATAVQSGFMLSPENAPAVREVCRRLDGIPLAIELAAARVAVLSPAQIAGRLDQRFRLLAGGERGAIERHATLRAAIDWSYELLEPDEQLVLARLSVFAGSCTLEAAEAVCGGGAIAPEMVLDLVSSLVARSLVVADTTDPAETSYRLLETIRQYAEERLDADDRADTNDRHARYYAAWLVIASERLRGPEQREWVARAEREAENVRTAILWALGTEERELAFTIVAAVGVAPIALLPPGRVVCDVIEQLLDLMRDAPTEHLARVVSIGAWVAGGRGDTELARARCSEALALDDGTDEMVVAVVWHTRLNLAIMEGDTERAGQYAQQLVEWARDTGAVFDLATVLAGLATIHANHGNVELALVEATESLELARRTGAPSAITMARAALASALHESDPDAARAHLRALAAPAALGLADEAALATMTVLGGRLGEVEATLRLGAQILDVTPSGNLILGAVLETAAVVLVSTAPEAAATLQGAVDAMLPGFSDYVGLRAAADPSVDTLLGGEANRLRDEGRRMSEDEAAVFARTVIDQYFATSEAEPVGG
jgi:predicted ATPase/class 3 adenylate cyclase